MSFQFNANLRDDSFEEETRNTSGTASSARGAIGGALSMARSTDEGNRSSRRVGTVSVNAAGGQQRVGRERVERADAAQRSASRSATQPSPSAREPSPPYYLNVICRRRLNVRGLENTYVCHYVCNFCGKKFHDRTMCVWHADREHGTARANGARRPRNGARINNNGAEATRARLGGGVRPRQRQTTPPVLASANIGQPPLPQAAPMYPSAQQMPGIGVPATLVPVLIPVLHLAATVIPSMNFDQGWYIPNSGLVYQMPSMPAASHGTMPAESLGTMPASSFGAMPAASHGTTSGASLGAMSTGSLGTVPASPFGAMLASPLWTMPVASFGAIPVASFGATSGTLLGATPQYSLTANLPNANGHDQTNGGNGAAFANHRRDDNRESL